MDLILNLPVQDLSYFLVNFLCISVSRFHQYIILSKDGHAHDGN